MTEAPEYRGHVVQFVGAAAGIVDKFGKRSCRDARVDEENVRIGPDDADGSEIFHRVVRRFRRYRENRDLRWASHQQHMSVGGRAGDRFRRERADRSWAVLDHELLPKRVAERLCDKTRNAVAIAARREGNEDLDRLLRPNLR